MTHYDVIVVGAGPTGLAAANVVAQAGHRVALFERHAGLYNLPRAGHIDNEVLRILQGLGCLDEVLEDSYPIERVPLLDSAGNFLLELVPAHRTVSSFPSVMMYQPTLETALYNQLQRYETLATIRLGWTVDGNVSEEGDGVRVWAQPSELCGTRRAPGEPGWTEFHCQYLIAADGSGSPVREALRIEREDFGFSERWLDVDLAYRRPCNFGPPALIGDPKRPHFFSPLGKRHHRFECRLFPEESAEEFSTPGKAWELLAQKGVGPDDLEIVRQAVYTFEYRVARRWRHNRIFLMGDAAHTICPLLGQGMSSGVRDAANLGWKLDLVLRGRASESILESYEIERRPHVREWADLSVKAGEFICITDPERAAARDAALRNGAAPPLRPPPNLVAGLLDLPPRLASGLAGQLFPQRTVRRDFHSGLFDQVVGCEFLLVAWSDPRPFLSDADRAFMLHIGMRWAWFSAPNDPESALVDETGDYRSFFEKNGVAAVVVRPDRYVFGGVRHHSELGALIDRLRQCLSGAER